MAIGFTTAPSPTADGRAATATVFCDSICISRVDWSPLAESLAGFLAFESYKPIVRRDPSSASSGAAVPPASPPKRSSYKPLHFQPSANEFCYRNELQEPYGLTTACAKVSDDQMRLEHLTIAFGSVFLPVPDDVLAKIDWPRLDRFSVLWEGDIPDQGMSYLECRIEFGGGPAVAHESRARPLHAPRTLIVTVRDRGKHVDYVVHDTASR